jgi:hypothetical protein
VTLKTILIAAALATTLFSPAQAQSCVFSNTRACREAPSDRSEVFSGRNTYTVDPGGSMGSGGTMYRRDEPPPPSYQNQSCVQIGRRWVCR